MTREPMGCAEAVRRLWDLLEDDLHGVDRQALDAHLSWCRRCCGELAFARELQRLLRERTGGPLPEAARQRLERVVDELGGTPEEGARR